MGLPIYTEKVIEKATPPAAPHEQEKELVAKNLSSVKRKIGIHSGKGGVGKTFVAINLAFALAQSRKVGLLDADIDCPNVGRFLNLRAIELEGEEGGKFKPLEHRGLKIVSSHFLTDNPSLPMIVRGPIKHKVTAELLMQAQWGELDALIIDLPPGTADVPMSSMLIGNLDGIIIVTTPQKESLWDARKSALMAKDLQVPVLGVVENMSGEIFGTGGGALLAEELDVPFLGSIPLAKEIREMSEKGNAAFTNTKFRHLAEPLTDAALGKEIKREALQRSFWQKILAR